MYQSFFAFTQLPFSIAPNPRLIYPTAQFQEALKRLKYGLMREGGIIVLTGEVGTGKTTLCRRFVRALPKRVVSGVVLNTQLGVDDLLSQICKALGAKGVSGQAQPGKAARIEKIEAIFRVLKTHFRQGRKTLLIFEEAQNLSPAALETLRLLTNLETDTTKLIHILLIGQPELNATLNRPDLRQLAQRVVSRMHLRPLSFEETESYITHRLTLAGGQRDMFKSAAIKAIYQHSHGVPRLINLLADQALLLLFEQRQKYAGAAQIHQAAAQLRGESAAPLVRGSRRSLYRAMAAGVAALLLMGAALLWFWQRPLDDWAGMEAPAAGFESAPDETAVPVILPEAEPEPRPDPVALFFSEWGVDGPSSPDPCSGVSLQGLACIQDEPIDLDTLITLNRPVLLHQLPLGGTEPEQNILLRQVDGERVLLVGAEGEQWLSRTRLQQSWGGSWTGFWQPMPGYVKPLHVGERSFQLTFWLQDSLNKMGLVNGRVLTGGVYTQALADKVRQIQRQQGLQEDGILGPQVIIYINQALDQGPVLSLK